MHMPAQIQLKMVKMVEIEPESAVPLGSLSDDSYFHHFDHFELDLRGHIHVWGATFSCLRLKLADIVPI